MPDERIETYINRSGIQGDTEFMLQQLNSVLDAFNKVNGIKISLGKDDTFKAATTSAGNLKKATDELAGSVTNVIKSAAGLAQTYSTVGNSLDDNIKQQLKLKSQMDSTIASISALRDAWRKTGIASEESKQQEIELLKTYESLKQANTELTRTVRLQVKEQDSASGSINELKANYDRLYQVYRSLTEADQQSEFGKKLSESLGDIKQKILALDGAAGNFSTNVGNYAGSLTPAFDALKGELEAVNKELAEIEARGKASFQNFGTRTTISGFAANQHQNQGTPSSGTPTDLLSGSGNQVSILNQDAEAYQKLTVQQKVLEGSLQRQAVGFKTANQEMRNAKNTLDTMTLAGLGNTEAFEKLNLAYTENEQKVKDLHREQAILTTDAPALTALTGVAKGIGGAYAIAAGGAAIFATGNEKVDKELQRLVAIMTFLQGLEEAVSVLKERNAIVTALQVTATKALNTVRQIEVAIFGEETAAQEANTVATEANAAAQEATAVGLEATAVAAETTAVAIEGVTVAEEAGAAGAITFRTALVSTGIGAIVIALIYGITKLVGAIVDWANADEKAIEKAKALAEANKELFDLNQKLNEVYEEGAIHRLNSLEKVDAAIKASGKNQFIQLDNERRIAEQQKQNAQDQLTRLGVTDAKRAELQSKQKSNSEALFDLQKEVVAATAKGDKDEIEKAQKKYDANKAVFDLFETKYTAVFKLIKEVDDADGKLYVNTITTAKAAADQLEKIAADSANRRYAIEKDAADRSLNDPKSSFIQRDLALKSGYQAEEELAQKHIAVIKQQISKQAITEEDGADQIANIQSDLNLKYKKALDDREKLRTEERDRNITAQSGITKSSIEADAAVQDAITKDEQRELAARLTALRANIEDKAKIINDDYQTQITLAKDSFKTEDEIAQLTSDRDRQLVTLAADTRKRVYDITTSYAKKTQEDLKTIEALQYNSDAADSYNKEVEALNDSYKKRLITVFQYQTRKAALDRQFAIDQAQALVDADKKVLALQIGDDEKYLDEIMQTRADLIRARETGDQSEIDQNEAKLEALLKAEGFSAAQIIAIRKKLAADTLALGNSTSKEKEAQDTALFDKEVELLKQTTSFLQSIGDARYDNEKAQIQSTIDAITKKAQTDVDAENASADSAQDKADKIAIINQRAQAQEEQLAARQKQVDIDKARFDKLKAITDIVINTAVAISKSLDKPYLIPIIAAIGAVEIATVAAQPLPTYKHGAGINGRPKHPGGDAEVGHGKRELAITPDGRMIVTPSTPTVMNFPKDTVVLPDANAAIDALIYSSFRGLDQTEEAQADTRTYHAMQQLIKENRRLQTLIANKKETHFHGSWAGWEAGYRSGNKWMRYIDEKTNF